MKAPKTRWECTACGYQTAKWLGKCPSCGGWNTIEESVVAAPAANDSRAMLIGNISGNGEPKLLNELDMPDYMRSKSGMNELDRVLG